MLSRKITLSLMITTATILTWSHVLAGPIETGESSPNASDDLAISNLAAAAAVDGHIYACVNAPWVQPCQNFNFVVNKCVNFPLLYQESISSIGPDVGFRCVLYQGVNCTGRALSLANPGAANLDDGTGFNDNLSAFSCFRGN